MATPFDIIEIIEHIASFLPCNHAQLCLRPVSKLCRQAVPILPLSLLSSSPAWAFNHVPLPKEMLWPDLYGFIMQHAPLQQLQWLRAAGCLWSTATFTAAARAGRLDVMQWLQANGCPMNCHAIAAAVENGSLTNLEWLQPRPLHVPPQDAYYYEKREVRCRRGFSLVAVRGPIEAVCWMLDCWQPDFSTVQELFKVAVHNGRLDVLQELQRRGATRLVGGGPTWPDAALIHRSMAGAAAQDQLEVVQWLHSIGAPLRPQYLADAVSSGAAKVARWLHSVGCRPDGAVIPGVANLELAEWLLEQKLVTGAAEREQLLRTQVKYGGVEALQWALQRGLPLDVAAHDTWNVAAVRRACELGFTYDAASHCLHHVANLDASAVAGAWDDVQWLLDHSPKSEVDAHSKLAMGCAAVEGQLGLLQRLAAEGHPIPVTLLHGAAAGGQAAVVRWLCQHGCHLDAEVFANALIHTKEEGWPRPSQGVAARRQLLCWLLQQGCPMDPELVTYKLPLSHSDVMTWMLNVGLPIPAGTERDARYS